MIILPIKWNIDLQARMLQELSFYFALIIILVVVVVVVVVSVVGLIVILFSIIIYLIDLFLNAQLKLREYIVNLRTSALKKYSFYYS